ncbi:hypothetical protein DID88_008151 [Monilinia fructigena]|uniref:Uncharacterized protein n=1 Tax=Monilinia fructigena TaxID=38457 RepID=A0A395J555_9HELO|nr:hypothetical protein DID88_008151 [Monilinia fructigena]
MTEKLVKGKQGNLNRRRPAMKGPVKQASTAVTNTFQNTTATDSLGVGQVTVRIDQTPSTKPEKRGRKRAAVREESDESPVQRKRINKSIANSLNVVTSKSCSRERNKTNRYMGGSERLGNYLKQQDGHFENGMGWPQIEYYDPFGEQGDELDEFQLSRCNV